MRHRPSGSRRQTIRKRRRTLGESGPRALLNQLACPCVAAIARSERRVRDDLHRQAQLRRNREERAPSLDRRCSRPDEDRILGVELDPRGGIGGLERLGKPLSPGRIAPMSNDESSNVGQASSEAW